MKIIHLYKNNIDFYEKKITDFFNRNLESYRFFHPHKLSWSILKNIILTKSKDFYGLFEDNNQIIGYGILRGWDERYEIPSLGIIIDKNYQGKGYGKQIMNYLHEISKKQGAEKIRLTVLKENYSAIILYKKLGYKLSEKDENNLLGLKIL